MRKATLTGASVLVLLLSSPPIGYVHSAEITLAQNGKPMASIVLPAETEFDRYLAEKKKSLEETLRKQNPELDDKAFARLKTRSMTKLQLLVKKPGDEEELAAEELQSIVEKISGAKLPIIRAETPDIPEGPVILLGTGFARRAGLGQRVDALHKDGLLCLVKDDSLVLAGRRARGTLYAVYEFLEELGCRWVLPGPFGEIYPSMKTITASIDKTENPSHTQRYFWCTYGHAEDYPRWTLRNKGNFVLALGDPRVHHGHALAQPLKWGEKQERYRTKAVRKVRERKKGPDGKAAWEWLEKEVWALPDEYYAMQKGELSLHIPNMSNPKVWDLYAE